MPQPSPDTSATQSCEVPTKLERRLDLPHLGIDHYEPCGRGRGRARPWCEFARLGAVVRDEGAITLRRELNGVRLSEPLSSDPRRSHPTGWRRLRAAERRAIGSHAWVSFGVASDRAMP